jgi:ankyrin repeat protein
VSKRSATYSSRSRLFSWFALIGGLATFGFALSPTSQELQSTGRRSNKPPVPARGKLGQDLFLAIDHRDTEGVRSLLKQGADPNSLNGLEFRPIYLAAASYQMDVMQDLLRAGAKPDAMSTYGTPLTFASISGNLVGAKMLLDLGANPNTIRSDGMSVLMFAANAGNPALVEELIKRRADVNTKDDGGETALSFAARAGHLEVGKMLLAAGAAVDSTDADGQTPLMVAAVNGHADFVKLLLSKGAKPNAKDAAGRTALVLAARYGDYPEVVRELINGGANPKAKDPEGKEVAAIASARGYAGCAAALGAGVSRPVLRSPREALGLSLKTLQSSMLQFAHSATCISCHHEGLGRIATGAAADRGFKLDPELQHVQLLRLRGMVTAMKPLHQAALKSPDAMKQVPLMEMNEVGTIDTWLLAGMAAHNEPPTDATAAMTMVMARQQSPDGCWTFSLPRVPMQSSFFTFTALAVKALKDFGPKEDSAEVAERLDKAKNWLLHSEAKTSEDRASRLLGLKWAGADAKDIETAAAQILADQRKDGGWSQLPNLQSDAYATGQALYALHTARGLPVSDKVYQSGVQFLLRTQDSDGTWFVSKRAIPANNYFDAGFPHGESQYSSFNGTCWATLALLETVQPSKRTASR